MKEIRLLCIGMGALALSPPSEARPEANAFLNKGVDDLRGIIRQVKNDPEVLERYEKHYGMSKWQIVEYFRYLKPGKIARSGAYIVYNVKPDGIVRSRLFNLKAGTLVYVDETGQPVLRKRCGNPMTKGPSKLSVADLIAEVPVEPPTDIRPIDDGPTPDPALAPEAPVYEEIPLAVSPDNPPIITPPVVTPPVITPTIVPPTEPPTIVKPNFEGPSLSWIAPLLAGGLVTTVDVGSDDGPPVIPEPATIGGGIVAMALYSLHRRRRR